MKGVIKVMRRKEERQDRPEEEKEFKQGTEPVECVRITLGYNMYIYREC